MSLLSNIDRGLRRISESKVSGTIYMHSTHKYPCHIIDFIEGKPIVIELFYHYYDHITFAFRTITFKDVTRQRGGDIILQHMIDTFPEMFCQRD